MVGFYCQKCEEFIGDLTDAENHAATHVGNHRIVSCFLHVHMNIYQVFIFILVSLFTEISAGRASEVL